MDWIGLSTADTQCWTRVGGTTRHPAHSHASQRDAFVLCKAAHFSRLKLARGWVKCHPWKCETEFLLKVSSTEKTSIANEKLISLLKEMPACGTLKTCQVVDMIQYTHHQFIGCYGFRARCALCRKQSKRWRIVKLQLIDFLFCSLPLPLMICFEGV